MDLWLSWHHCLEKNLKNSMSPKYPVNYRIENRPSKLEGEKNDQVDDYSKWGFRWEKQTTSTEHVKDTPTLGTVATFSIPNKNKIQNNKIKFKATPTMFYLDIILLTKGYFDNWLISLSMSSQREKLSRVKYPTSGSTRREKISLC